MNANALRAEFAKNGLTQARVARLIGVSESTFSRKMKKGTFGIDEANKMIDALQIENPSQIFFAQNGLVKSNVEE